ncbi:MAG: hypothetical protein RQ864_09375 [Lutibacter sp.]|nr:hypothetical protein [Lutibacter sp.]MDT8418006.1 hypothetical protein [Lutibacter sp.]
MKATELNPSEKSKKNVPFATFNSTKRVQWNKYRRYGIFVS